MQRNQDVSHSDFLLNRKTYIQENEPNMMPMQVDDIYQKHHAILQLSAPLSFYKFAF